MSPVQEQGAGWGGPWRRAHGLDAQKLREGI